jgi:hypothetical protein
MLMLEEEFTWSRILMSRPLFMNWLLLEAGSSRPLLI